MRFRVRPRAVLAAAVASLFLAALFVTLRPAGQIAAVVTPWQTLDQIPPQHLAQFLEVHQRGLGYMERYDYPHAIEAFEHAHELAPGLIAGSINLAIATLNNVGAQSEKDKAAGGEGFGEDKFARAISLLTDVIRRDPGNLYAHYCRGLIRDSVGEFDAAHQDFQVVVDRDPNDAHAWYYLAKTLMPAESGAESLRKNARDRIPLFKKAIEHNPYLVYALYGLAESVRVGVDPAEFLKLRQEFAPLDPRVSVAAPGDLGETTYGELGRYATVIDPFPNRPHPPNPVKFPRFETPQPLAVELPKGDRWVRESDFRGAAAWLGMARQRFGAAVATLDVDNDGQLDLLLAAAVVDEKGQIRDALLVNHGEGRFEDATRRYGLPLDRPSLSIAAGDFDADRRVDLCLSGLEGPRVFRNTARGTFADVTSEALGGLPEPAVIPVVRWMDLDQDGDLDLYLVRFSNASHAADALAGKPQPGLVNLAFRNDGQPPKSLAPPDKWAPDASAKPDERANAGLSLKLTPWTDSAAQPMLGGVAPHTGLAILDIDNDRDLDLVLSHDSDAATVVLNDRLGRFHVEPVAGLKPEMASGMLVADLDKDGRGDLVAPSASGRSRAFRNVSTIAKDGSLRLTFEAFPLDARNLRSAIATDLDLDTWTDLVALAGDSRSPTPTLARNEGARFASSSISVGPDLKGGLQGMNLSQLVGDPLPDLLMVRNGSGPSLAKNLGNGRHWISLAMGGRWDVNPKHMRTNSEGLGARIVVEGDGLNVPYDFTTPESGPAQSVAPLVLGLGDAQKARVLRVKWPDGVLQAEMEVSADQVFGLVENNRKEGSCPVLFTWNGRRFVCLGDFLGGGGLGYLVTPGKYGQPDRDEAVPISFDQLEPIQGAYRMSITEPMSELAYVDRLTLDVVDRPPGVTASPDERFAPNGNRPSGLLMAWREAIDPVRATDLKGRDVAAELKAFDRVSVDEFARLKGWVGYAEEHGIILDFGDRLAKFGPADRLVLGLAGYVEYPYSQTNYAAAMAGLAIRPPVLERQQEDGSWVVLEPDPGYPAGMARLTLLELTGKLGGPRCVLRLRTTMDLGWDQAFVARLEDASTLKVQSLPIARANLAFRGYTREVSPDGKLPLVYDYDHVDAAPLQHLPGNLTRFGDVAPLLRNDDDQLCVIGPGDEIKLEFDARAVPELPQGWTRSFVLRSVGYCKDADPFTAGSDHVGPLPWRGMPGDYPFGPAGERPRDPAYDAYLRTYQTRAVGR